MINKTAPEPLLILGRSVRQRRLQIGLSQEKLAYICKFDRTYISLVERGKRNISLLNLQKLAIGLNIPVSELLKEI